MPWIVEERYDVCNQHRVFFPWRQMKELYLFLNRHQVICNEISRWAGWKPSDDGDFLRMYWYFVQNFLISYWDGNLFFVNRSSSFSYRKFFKKVYCSIGHNCVKIVFVLNSKDYCLYVFLNTISISNSDVCMSSYWSRLKWTGGNHNSLSTFIQLFVKQWKSFSSFYFTLSNQSWLIGWSLHPSD